MKCTKVYAVIYLIQAILLDLVIFITVRMLLEKQERIIQMWMAVIIAAGHVIQDKYNFKFNH